MVEALHSLVNHFAPNRCTATHLQALIKTAMLFSAIYIIFDMFREKCELCFFRVHWWPDARGSWVVHQVQSRQAGTTAGVTHSRVRNGRGQIRHRLSRSIGVASKPRMMPSNSVTLALSEILHSLAMDTLLTSWGQHRKAVGHKCPFLDNPSSLTSWRYAVYQWHLHKRAPKYTCITPPNNNTERTQHNTIDLFK